MYPDRYPDAKRLRPALADFLDQYAWSHYCTLTFDRHRGTEGAARCFTSFVRRLERSGGGAIGWFAVRERGGCGGLHLHVLLANTEHLPVAYIQTVCWSYGYARVSVFRPGDGATRYVTKDIYGRDAEWDFSLKRRHRRRPDGAAPSRVRAPRKVRNPNGADGTPRG